MKLLNIYLRTINANKRKYTIEISYNDKIDNRQK